MSSSATSITATMTTIIPRRPSGVSPLAPPSGPLPALPSTKTRLVSKPLPDVPDPSDSSRPPLATNLPTSGIRPPSRAALGSALPSLAPSKARSTSAVPNLVTAVSSRPSSPSPASASSSSGIPTAGKAVRKTASIGAFPLPPKVNTRVSSLPPSPLSTTTTLADANGAQDPPKARRDSSKHRSAESGIKRPKTRSSGYGVRARGSGAGLAGSPSLLNGTGDNFISSAEGARSPDSLLNPPSPPQSRSSSANGSYHTDGTAVEDAEDGPEERGRPKSSDTITDGPRGDAKDIKGNVLVSVRVRPDATADGTREDEGEWMVDGRRSLISYQGREGGDYRYDNVFSPHDNNARVYDNAAKRLVRRVMEGYHGTVFAYGMTGTGKTFSMQGTGPSPGVIPLAITDIFSYIRENPGREFLLRVSYLEIYNEKIYDLLSQTTPGQPPQEEIKLREDAKRGVYASPLKEEIVQSPNQLLRVIARGDVARRTSSTQFNARSSRSHAVVQIVVESRERTPNHGAYFEKETRRADRILPGGVLVSTLSLIDLAGSEKAAESKERRTEGAHINKSLLTLGTVIGRLSGDDEKDGATKPATDKDKALKHLPYRDSKLTRLLQPALSGNSLVSILCTIQLSSANTSAALATSHTGETINTLKFASRAKNNIVSHAKRNESHANSGDAGSRALLDRYRIEIQDLRQQLEQQGTTKEDPEKREQREELEQDRKLEEELERQEAARHEEQMLEMHLARTALKERISHLNRLILSSKSLGVNSGRFSSASVPLHRMSVYSNNEFGRPVSVKSRESVTSLARPDSSATLEVPSPDEPNGARGLSSGSIASGVLPVAQPSQMVEDEAAGDEDGSGGYDDDPDAHASMAQQNGMLQADLADKNRYIATLEKRLLQARRTSHSRVSMAFSRASIQGEDGGLEAVVRDKDREIDELRAKLDDQMRMVTALRSAARKREMLDIRKSNSSDGTARPDAANGNVPHRVSSRASSQSGRLREISSHRSNPSTASRSSTGMVISAPKGPLSPMAILSPSISEHSDNGEAKLLGKTARRKSVDEMTMLLDQMIQEKIESGQVTHGDRGSLRIKRDTVMSPPDAEYTNGLSNVLSAVNGGGYMHTLTTQFEEHSESLEQEEQQG